MLTWADHPSQTKGEIAFVATQVSREVPAFCWKENVTAAPLPQGGRAQRHGSISPAGERASGDGLASPAVQEAAKETHFSLAMPRVLKGLRDWGKEIRDSIREP